MSAAMNSDALNHIAKTIFESLPKDKQGNLIGLLKRSPGEAMSSVSRIVSSWQKGQLTTGEHFYVLPMATVGLQIEASLMAHIKCLSTTA